MISWLKRALGMSSEPPATTTRPTPAASTSPAAAPPVFDWASLAPAKKKAVAAEPDVFPELADWAGAIHAKCMASWDSISAFPPIATKIFSLLEHPDFKLQELVNLIHQDPTISAEVLRAANSALFSRGVTSLGVRDAVQRLGAKEVASIAAISSTRSLFDIESRIAHEQVSGRARSLWHHSMTCAFTAGWLAMENGRGNLDRSFLGGMLHDIGKTMGLRGYASLLVGGELPQSSDERIDRLLDEVHLPLGREAIVRWNLPEFFQLLSSEHHGPAPEALAADRDFHIVRLVSGMNMLRTGAPASVEELQHSADVLGLKPPAITALHTSLKSYAERADQLSAH